jgi:hypothetical protein
VSFGRHPAIIRASPSWRKGRSAAIMRKAEPEMTAAIRIVHLSDTHLSATHAYFEDNWHAVREAVIAERPDLVQNQQGDGNRIGVKPHRIDRFPTQDRPTR